MKDKGKTKNINEVMLKHNSPCWRDPPLGSELVAPFDSPGKTAVFVGQCSQRMAAGRTTKPGAGEQTQQWTPTDLDYLCLSSSTTGLPSPTLELSPTYVSAFITGSPNSCK